jgi:ATP-dependent DNA helicase RecG
MAVRLDKYGKKALELIMEGKSFFLTGKAGTGKSSQDSVKDITQETTQIILKAIHKNASVTRKELAELCGISSDGIKWQLKQMQEKGLIRRAGPDKGGHWEVIEK